MITNEDKSTPTWQSIIRSHGKVMREEKEKS